MISKNVYAEVFEILSYMNKSVVMKIPIEILESINRKRNRSYISKIDRNDIFNTNNINNDTVKILSWIDVNFWMDENKKEDLKRLARERSISKYTIEIKDIFKEENKKINEEGYKGSLIKVKKESIIKKIINKVKKFLN